MNQGQVIASVSLLFAGMYQLPATPAVAAAVTTEKVACDLTKARVAARGDFPISTIAFCDVIVPDAQPKGYYVLALHSTRQCDGICSTHLGWFAVEKATGRVFEWDINEDKVERLVKVRR